MKDVSKEMKFQQCLKWKKGSENDADESCYEVFSLLFILAEVMHPLTTNIFECVNLKS